MKKLLMLTVVSLFLTMAGTAQTKALNVVNIKTPTVQCEMCKNKIESYLKRVDGVTFVNVKYKQKVTQVKFLTDRTNEEVIKAAIANAGYDANEISANPETYKALPKCCKKPEDGGGMKKQ
jgi:copper chaperone CopZ